MSRTIVFIGAGSIGFTRKLVKDILTVPELRDSRIVFTDIDAQNMERTARLCQRDIDAQGIAIRIETEMDRRKALEHARYVFCLIRVGGLEAFTTDIEIPLQYGIDQCVGDTLCAGGIMYAQRTIPVLLDICKDIREVAEPGAILLNYANPMAMNTWACETIGGVTTIGLCHGVQHGHEQIVRAIGAWIARHRPADSAKNPTVRMKDVEIVCSGINHQTWYISIRYQGEEWVPRMPEAFRLVPEFVAQERVRLDMLDRFGYYSTESNGHLSEYLPWYRKRGDEMLSWVHLGNWIDGETAGYLRTCTEQRNYFDSSFPLWMQEPPLVYTQDSRSLEHGSYIIEALETGRGYRGHFNRPNGGIITNLSADAIIESPGYIDATGLHMLHIGDLPAGCAAVCSRSIDVQRLAVRAALEGSLPLLQQAMLLDPLTGAMCGPEQIRQLADEMVQAQQRWLPQYQQDLPAISQRLADNRQVRAIQGHTGWQGNARLRSGLHTLRGWVSVESGEILSEDVFGVVSIPETAATEDSPVMIELSTTIDTDDTSLRLGACPQDSELHGMTTHPLTIIIEGEESGSLELHPSGANTPTIRWGSSSTGIPFRLGRGKTTFRVLAPLGTQFDLAIRRHQTEVSSRSAAEAVQQ